MSKLAIITDSNSGITQAEGKELGVIVVPMPFTIAGEWFLRTECHFAKQATARVPMRRRNIRTITKSVRSGEL